MLRRKPKPAMANRDRTFRLYRLQFFLGFLLLIAACVTLLIVIVSSPVTSQAESASSLATIASAEAAEDDGWSQDEISSAVGPLPVPTFSCQPCTLPEVIREDFDNVIPPVLPPDWIATNAQGPPPLWVTSSSGVPAPPA